MRNEKRKMKNITYELITFRFSLKKRTPQYKRVLNDKNGQSANYYLAIKCPLSSIRR